jgi:putative phosphoesterase
MSKLGVISDTHRLLDETILAVHLFQEHEVQTVIHCGDIGGSAIVRAFQGLDTHFVFGNSDGEDDNLRLAAQATGNHFHDWFGSIEQSGKRIAFLHGHQSSKFEHELENGHWDLLCFGHTHIASLQMYGSTMVLNPGAFKRVFRPTIAIVTLPELTVELFTI